MQLKKIKKFILKVGPGILGSAFLLQAYTMPVFANTLSNNYSSQSISNARVEQVTWKYRTYKGKKQRRLWSITYEKWLTDWLPA